MTVKRNQLRQGTKNIFICIAFRRSIKSEKFSVLPRDSFKNVRARLQLVFVDIFSWPTRKFCLRKLYLGILSLLLQSVL